MSTELYRRYRPKTLDEVIGQDTAVAKLKSLFSKGLPHVLLLHGETSGVGKTSIARILARMLGCKTDGNNHDFIEKNCADCRSIDDVREIKDSMGRKALNGKARVWILDEVVQLPTATQQAFLKILEDTPDHVWFFLCTTDTSKLIPTVLKRCHPIALQSLPDALLLKLLNRVATAEKYALHGDVSKRIVDLSQGSARHALILLEAAFAFTSPKDQIQALESSQSEHEGIELARAIFRRAKTDELLKIAERLNGDLEAVRRLILGYASTVMLRARDKRKFCNQVITHFRDSWYDCGKAGLLSALYELSQSQ